MKLIPLQAKQVYVAGSKESLQSILGYKSTPGLVNQHVVCAIFEPINDTNMVLAMWAFGGFNPTPRDSVKILDLEAGELLPAWTE